ncbi:MAG: prepilin-type N-terminal cleavage/methylation domain-containing protein [Deltaproteobacteria bacterium]|nr:prepilin-type N-terminal cleavage/methylation domain-containing protein [Deltaproteobacteria bacterium]
MLQNDRGFSLIELVVVMGIFVGVIAIAGSAFNVVLNHASIQSKTAESNIEGVLGLEMMKKDISSAGFGLPWSFQTSITYSEASQTIPAVYNDAPSGEPRGVWGEDDVNAATLIAGTDYLVIRATSIGTSRAAQRWSYMNYTGATKPNPVVPFTWPKDNLVNANGVIVVRVGLSGTFTKELVMAGETAFSTNYGTLSSFEPNEPNVTHYIYGVDDGTPLRMPFNRADYYVKVPTDAAELPQRCAPNTGILYKATVNQNGGALRELPLLDCVADMQVVYTLEPPGSGTTTETNDIFTPPDALSAEQIRERLKAVKVYVLTHEGGRDRHYSYPNSTINVGPAGSGRTFTLTNIPDYSHYRWKVYFLTAKPENLNIATQ